MRKYFLLFCVLAVTSFACHAYDFSAVAPTGQTLYYNIDGPNAIVTCPGVSTAWGSEWSDYTMPTETLTIPSEVTYNSTTYSVISIGNYAFNYCSGLTSVTIPNSVTSIGDYAFSSCSGLTSITITNSVTSIGYGAFSSCSGLTSVSIPNSVTSIGDWAFSQCSSLTSVTLPNSVTSIGNSAFCQCWSLTSVTIPNSVTSIGGSAFSGCSELTSVTIPNSVTSIGERTFSSCSDLTSITIPNSVTSIGDYAFYNCSGLTYLAIPNSVTSIGSGAFEDCSGLTSVTIPNSVTSIGGDAFSGCSELTSVTIPNSVTSIGDWAFAYCSGLTSVTVPVISIGEGAFFYCSGLTSVTIPNSVTSIGGDAFFGCSELTSVIIPNSVTSIGSYAFSSCTKLKTIYNLSVLSIGTSSYGLSAKRVIKPTKFGTGNNAIYQIDSTTYSFVDVEDDVATHIPRSTIPANFLYKDGGSWLAKEIVLTDDTNRFEAPVAFTADTVTYIREFTNSNRSTLYLPFTASVPANFEVYDFSNFENNTLYFTEHTGDIAAYTPYLVGYNLAKDGTTTKCIIAQGETDFPASVEDNFNTESHGGMTFQGVLERTEMTSTNNYGYSNGFFVQSGGSAHVNPFRCFFSYSSSNPMGIPPTLIVDIVDGELAIDEAEMPAQQTPTYYSNDVYDMMGRLIRRNAQSLEGLPKGVYIWKGQKVLAY